MWRSKEGSCYMGQKGVHRETLEFPITVCSIKASFSDHNMTSANYCVVAYSVTSYGKENEYY